MESKHVVMAILEALKQNGLSLDSEGIADVILETQRNQNAKWMECIPEKFEIIGEPLHPRNDNARWFNKAIDYLTDNAKQAGLIDGKTNG